MTAVGIPITYDGPVLTKPRVSLLTTAEIVEHDNERFAGGIDISYDTCDDTHISVWEYCDDTPPTLGKGAFSTQATFQPFTVSAGITCSTYSNFDAQTFQLKAKRKLEAKLSAKLELELWDGTVLANDYLASSDATDLTSASEISVASGVSALEQAMGQRGFIHMTPRMLGVLLATTGDQVIRSIDPQTGVISYYTFMGNPIVPGYGYSGKSPAGGSPDADAEWIYSSTPVVVHLGPITYTSEKLNESINRATNDVTFYAQQTAVATFDTTCAHYAAKVSRGYTVI